jgi:anti-sigma regulatory factor (Ser/Thr protein kinase)
MPAKLTYLSDPGADPALLPHWLTLGRLTLAGLPQNVRPARRFIADTIGETHRQCDTALLLTSELVTNAITHSRSGRPGGTLDLVVSATCSALLISVTDDGSEAGLPAMRNPPGGVNGNGLVLVDSLSDGWGYHQGSDRTAVWFRLRALGAARPGLPARSAAPDPAATAPARTGSLIPQPHR